MNQQSKQQHAGVIDAFGSPGELHLGAVPVSAPTGTQILVRVAAAAVNPVDLSTRAGKNIPADAARFPMVLGWDVAGTVESLGPDAAGWAIGDRVAAMTFQVADQNGTYAEHVTLDAGLLSHVPTGLELTRAATVPLAGLTARQVLDLLALPAGSTLLINGPTGAVGGFALQLATHAGITVVAVANPERAAAARALGATTVVDRGDFSSVVRRLHPHGVDAAIDVVGGAAAHQALAAVRDDGRYATAVPPYIDPTGPFDGERGIDVQLLTVRPDAAQLTELLRAAGEGALATPVEEVYPLSSVAAAHLHQERGNLRGKIVLVP
jgi:NADPH:quinone reductase